MGEPLRVGEENEVLKVVTEEDFLVLGGDWFASSKGATVLLFVRTEGCKLRERILDSNHSSMLEDALRCVTTPCSPPPCQGECTLVQGLGHR